MKTPVFRRSLLRRRVSAKLEGELIRYRDFAEIIGAVKQLWQKSPTSDSPDAKLVDRASHGFERMVEVAEAALEEAQLKESERLLAEEAEAQGLVVKIAEPGQLPPGVLAEAWPGGPAALEKPQTKPRQPEPWRFGFAKGFRKAVEALDRKLQGRILEAVVEIESQPLTARGDTVKALTGNLSGFWRYRIGDFRLVYYPDYETRTITLYDFASRGSAYD